MSEQEQITATILRAHSELEQALGELEKMPAFDPGAIAFSAHETTITGVQEADCMFPRSRTGRGVQPDE